MSDTLFLTFGHYNSTRCMNNRIHRCWRKAGASRAVANFIKSVIRDTSWSKQSQAIIQSTFRVPKMVNFWDAPQGLGQSSLGPSGAWPTKKNSFTSCTCHTCARVADTTRASKQFSCSELFHACSSIRGGFSAHCAQCSYTPAEQTRTVTIEKPE